MSMNGGLYLTRSSIRARRPLTSPPRRGGMISKLMSGRSARSRCSVTFIGRQRTREARAGQATCYTDRAMSDDGGSGKRLPLFPLSDLVHFPHTDLKLEIFEQRYRRLVRDVSEGADAESRRIGLVLLKPGGRRHDGSHGQPPAVFPGGTAGRIVRC